MAITISGENNNDRILASDGVIDQISGINIVGLITASHINVGSNIQLGNAGIVTATTFVGNVTGNVNSTSPLLLQTGGSERIRITGNNEIGIAGANYGSAGQVLTSGGSGSAVSWSTISTDLVNDSSPQLGGDLDVNGKKIKFPDLTGSVNNILYFGTGEDLLIYHLNNINYIQCENSRTLRIQQWTGSGNETMANFIPNGAVELYHNNDLRLQTWSDAVNIYGDEGEDAILHLYADDGDDNNDKWMLRAESSASRFSIENYSTGSWVENIRITAGGLVELKHADGTTKMHTDTTGITVANRITASGDTNTYINVGPNDIIDLYTGGTNVIRMDASGRLLLGTTTEGRSTADHLTIASTGHTGMTIRSGTSSGGNISFSDGTSGDDENRGLVSYDHASNFMRFFTNATEKVRITSGGDFGIGTNNPQSRLEVKDNSSNNYGTTIRLSQGYNSVFSEVASNFGGSMTLNAGQGGGTPIMHFQVNDNEKMRITNDGIVNIGVSSPQYAKKLNVQGGNDYTLSLSNQDYTGHAAGSLSGIEGRLQCGGGVWSSSGVRFVKHNGTSGDKHTRLELYATDGYANKVGLVVQPDGEITKPLQPSFRAGLNNNTTVASSSHIVFNDTSATWHHNIGNHYNTSNGRFTAPVDGVYSFDACVIFGPNISNNTFMGDSFLYDINGGYAAYSGRRGYYVSGSTGNQYYVDHMSCRFDLSEGDYVQIRNGSPWTGIHGNTYYTWFAGTLLG